MHRMTHVLTSCVAAVVLAACTGSVSAETESDAAPVEEYRLLSDEEAQPYITDAVESCIADGHGREACSWPSDTRFALGDRGSVVTVSCGGTDTLGTDGVETALPYWECPPDQG